ncbi:hypothetical protein K469DRAFT_602421 [Zopfia rhizophila CBS 207.26]|uniref:Clr5 domain-containing protein n=1 Tax=Zopfia rhizophila CBS 207.26 TaxID=1314779 RepID=A0A6A6DF13_9PEZI|nr:hypothetical protein K469DRAFT_602421 [Zopfia rhizophila CBS 207.26]
MDYPSRRPPNIAPASQPQFGLSYTGHRYPPAQQVYGAYSTDQDIFFVQQRHNPSGQVASLPYHAPYPSSLPTVLSSHAQHDAEIAGNDQSTSAPAEAPSPMAPPARPRKRKAPTLRAEDWEPYKDRILDLHTVQGLSLPEVRQIIEKEYGFQAKERQYRTRISQWGMDKNVKPQEMAAIVRKRQRRKLVETNKGQLVFEVRGSQVEPQKIERWMKRKGVVESSLYAPSPAACKLSTSEARIPC